MAGISDSNTTSVRDNAHVEVIGADGTPIGNVGDRLKVETTIDTSASGSVPTVSNKLRYVDMNASSGGVARLTKISQSWVNVFSYNGSGIVLNFLLNLENSNEWHVRFVVDSQEIFEADGFMTEALQDDAIYDLDDAAKVLSANEGNIGISLEEHERFAWVCPSGFPIRYTTNVTVKVRRQTGKADKKFRAGFITLTKET